MQVTITNGAWNNLASGLTFKIEGTNALGTSESYTTKSLVFASTMVTQNLEVVSKDFKSLFIYDAVGRVILISEQAVNDVSALAAGTYLGVVVQKNGKKVTSKFIKK